MPFDNQSDFEALTKRAADQRRLQDREDLGNEQAGRDAGRQRRFLPRDGAAGDDPERKTREAAHRTALELLLLSDPVYAAAYERAVQMLDEAEALVNAEIDAARSALAEAETDLGEIRERAARLGDGTRVYRRSDGAVVDEMGRIVSGAEAAGVIWPLGAPGYEAYLAAKAKAEAAKTSIAELELYQVDVLGGWRHRLEDEDAPPSLDELEALEDLLVGRAPQSLRPQLEAGFECEPPDDGPTGGEPAMRSSAIALPKI